MIDRHPAPGEFTEWVMEPYQGNVHISLMVHDRPRERVSALLGSDGEPLLVPYPRPKIGFDLTPRKR